MFCVCHAFVSVHCCLVFTCLERADFLAPFRIFDVCLFFTIIIWKNTVRISKMNIKKRKIKQWITNSKPKLTSKIEARQSKIRLTSSFLSTGTIAIITPGSTNLEFWWKNNSKKNPKNKTKKKENLSAVFWLNEECRKLFSSLAGKTDPYGPQGMATQAHQASR